MTSTDVAQHATARELSKEEYEAWVRDSFAAQQIIREGLMEARGGLWKAAEAMYHFGETSGWLALGYDTVGEWLADPDITLTRATYYRMTEAWRELHVVRQVDVSTLRQLDLTKTQIVLPALREGKADLEDTLADVETLGARDLREKYSALLMPALPDGYEPTGDGIDSDNGDEPVDVSAEPPTTVSDDDDVELVLLHAAKLMLGVLLRVKREVGPEDRKAMSKSLREAVDDAIGFAQDQGIDDAR